MERKTSKSGPTTPEYSEAVATKADKWVAACGGQEIEFVHRGIPWLYVYNPARNEHGYLNMETDIVQPEAPWFK